MSTDRTTTLLTTRWMCVLVSLLGALELLMALGAGSALIRVVGVVGGLALAATPWVAGRVRGAGLLLLAVGTVPFVAVTITSLMTPVLAVVAWILMGLVHRDRARAGLTAPVVPLHLTRQRGPAAT
jgi:hypothetical protein